MAERINFAELRQLLVNQRATWQAHDGTPNVAYDVEHHLGAAPPEGHPTLEDRESSAATFVGAELEIAKAVTLKCGAKTDWRNHGGNFVTSVKDQKTCGSCVAFGCCATVEATWQIDNHRPGNNIDFSEADLFYCLGALQGRNCENGWWPDPALTAFQTKGVVDEKCFPYTPGDQPCKLCRDSQHHKGRIRSYTKLTTHAQMRQWLCERGPLVACFSVYEDFFAYRGGVYHHVTGVLKGGHCVCVVGYDDTLNCWICKNSWGSGWGMSGFFEIGYGQCGIDSEMWGVVGVTPCNPLM